MFAAFQIEDIQFNNSDHWVQRGKESETSANQSVSAAIDQFMKPDGAVDAAAMMNEWFPDIPANVFISHSRADKSLALGLAGWLKDCFGLEPFIDSCVWSHANGLIKALDDKFCKTGPDLYSYPKSLVTAAHVHMMLSTALTQMMDRCECVFFLNTSNSISSKTLEEMVDSSNGSTHSPWLFHEISMMQMLRRRMKEEHRDKLINFSEGMEKIAASIPRFDYPVTLAGIPTLVETDLHAWVSREAKQKDALDALYVIKDPHSRPLIS